MSFAFRLPDLGEGIAEGHIVRWLVKEGDTVAEHQEMLELETDKALVRVPAPQAGTILKINFPEGSVKVGEILCVIGSKGEKVSAGAPQRTTTFAPAAKTTPPLAQKTSASTPASKSAKKSSSTVIGELEEAPDETEAKPVPVKKTAAPQILALPAVRKLAQDMNVDITTINGSGKDGRITEDDVRKAAGETPAQQSPTPSRAPSITFEQFGRVIRMPLKGIRKTIADNMTQSLHTAAHVTHMDTCDITLLHQYKEHEKEAAENKGVHLTLLPFIVKACTLALKEFPWLNASLDDAKGDIVLKQYFNIGFAVDTPHGLMVPVIKNANEKTIIEIGRDIYKFAELSRTREIELKDLQGGTFTITNIGSLGGTFATPIINYPEVAILALGKSYDAVVPTEGKLAIRKLLPVSLSFDHRLIDGAMAAKFVNEIKRHLENPDALLMGY